MTDSPDNRTDGHDAPTPEKKPESSTAGNPTTDGTASVATAPAAAATPATPAAATSAAQVPITPAPPTLPAAATVPIDRNPPAYGERVAPIGSSPEHAPSAGQPIQASLPAAADTQGFDPNRVDRALGEPRPYSEGSGTAPRKARGRAGVGVIVAALAVGAIIGGVSGAGVVVAVTGGNRVAPSFSSGNGPANIVVNDASTATTVTAVAASAGPSVVTIQVSDSSSSSAGTGSGVILSADGYVVTNTHVVTLDGASSTPTVSVQTSDGHLYQAKVVGTDPISDLAVIKIDAGNTAFRPATFADSSKLNVGDIAVAIGAPLGLANTVTNGIVSSLNRSITVASSAPPSTTGGEAPKSTDGNGDQGPFDFWQFGTQNPSTTSSTIALSVIQTDAAINPGNSGGALLDSAGHVIGINVAIASAGSTSGSSAGAGSIGVGFAIPSNLAKRIANELITDGKGSHGLLGASVGDVTASSATVVGASVQDVTSGGAAAVAGLQKGDIITAIAGLPITGKTDLTAQVRALAAGSTVTVGYVRGGNSATASVTLGTLG